MMAEFHLAVSVSGYSANIISSTQHVRWKVCCEKENQELICIFKLNKPTSLVDIPLSAQSFFENQNSQTGVPV